MLDPLGQNLAADQGGVFQVDLAAQRITTPSGETIDFDVNPLKKRSLLEGQDDISLTLNQEADIAAFQAQDRVRRPWIYDPAGA